MTFLWNHEPAISSPPEEVLHHFFHEEGQSIFEAGVFRLESQSFLFIRFSTEDKSDKNIGITELEEFDTEQEAVIVFDSCVKENTDEK
jgi:hypothetical protein